MESMSPSLHEAVVSYNKHMFHTISRGCLSRTNWNSLILTVCRLSSSKVLRPYSGDGDRSLPRPEHWRQKAVAVKKHRPFPIMVGDGTVLNSDKGLYCSPCSSVLLVSRFLGGVLCFKKLKYISLSELCAGTQDKAVKPDHFQEPRTCFNERVCALSGVQTASALYLMK